MALEHAHVEAGLQVASCKSHLQSWLIGHVVTESDAFGKTKSTITC